MLLALVDCGCMLCENKKIKTEEYLNGTIPVQLKKVEHENWMQHNRRSC